VTMIKQTLQNDLQQLEARCCEFLHCVSCREGIRTAGELRAHYGDELIGRLIVTEPYGAFPGGPAKVLELYDDSNAPEIVLYVRYLYRDIVATNENGELGVFENEVAHLLNRAPEPVLVAPGKRCINLNEDI
jgi:hypothetical protein